MAVLAFLDVCCPVTNHKGSMLALRMLPLPFLEVFMSHLFNLVMFPFTSRSLLVIVPVAFAYIVSLVNVIGCIIRGHFDVVRI